MKIISHRGIWNFSQEKNTALAFSKSFDFGFGVETDIRDYSGNLVISHDIPESRSILRLDEFFKVISEYNNSHEMTLALNIKADGLANKIKDMIGVYNNLDYFFFDMSVPDTKEYIKKDLPFFSRVSEVEKNPVWLESAKGVWLDSFDSVWFDLSEIYHFLDLGKKVCVVSSELHGRNYEELWRLLKPLKNVNEIMLCTDEPEIANNYFNGI